MTTSVNPATNVDPAKNTVRSAMRRTGLELQHQVEQFYYAEMELLDDHRYKEWITLFTEDCYYWMPTRMTRTIRERSHEVSAQGEGAHWDDDHTYLAGRVRRVTSGMQWSEEPPSRTRHMLMNIRVDEVGDGNLKVKSNFYVYRSRLERHQDWFIGERVDELRPAEPGFGYPFKIAGRKVVLEQTTILSPSVSIFF